jgi:glycosyltransferase involved in cell wall biosynthesis
LEVQLSERKRVGGVVKTAVVHEWVSAAAGSEQVFAALARAFPEAELHALTSEPGVDLGLPGRSITTTFLDRKALRNRRNLTLPLMPLAWRALGRGAYDLVITSHHSFAISNKLADPVRGRQLAYVHSPARYLWTPEIDVRGAGFTKTAPRALLRGIEKRAAQGLAGIAANSATVRERIRTYWDREATVIHPPVRVEYFAEAFTPSLDLPDEYLLSHGRWIPYKGHMLAIDTAERLGIPLIISGQGPDEMRLRERAFSARVPVTLAKRPSDAEVRELMSRAVALLFPVEEDFGITPVEAQAAGTPVVSLRRGGSLETVRDSISGILVDEATPEALAAATTTAMGLSADACRTNSLQFSGDTFLQKVRAWVVATEP